MNWYPTYMREHTKAQTFRRVLNLLETMSIVEVIRMCRAGMADAESEARAAFEAGESARKNKKPKPLTQ